MNETVQLTPAAQYVRMSTEDHQPFSIDNQTNEIGEYAARHGFRVVTTYADPGKSGLDISHRCGLRALLQDVLSGTASYKAILVYDVSRWGRFQDVDESAHYEFLCKKAGIKVHYCAEPFCNDDTMANAVMKALKRAMAGEYSRELSDKSFKGARAMVMRGFSHGGFAVYGLRRMLCSASGDPKCILGDNQRKFIKADRIKLVPGPKEEIDWVRKIFHLFAEHKKSTIWIAKYLNKRGVPKKGAPWNNQHVLKILRNEKYVGTMVWGKRTRRLQSRDLPVPKEQWTVVPNAIKPIVSRKLFEKAQRVLLHHFPQHYSDVQLITKLSRLLRRKHRLSARIINRSRVVPSSAYYEKRFGTLQRVYELAGYRNKKSFVLREQSRREVTQIHMKVLQQLISIFGSEFTVVRRDDKVRPRILRFANGLRLSIAVCRYETTVLGHSRWVFQCLSARRHGYMTLLCRCNKTNTGIRDFWLLPSVSHLLMSSLLKERDERLNEGIRLRRLEDLKTMIEVNVSLAASQT